MPDIEKKYQKRKAAIVDGKIVMMRNQHKRSSANVVKEKVNETPSDDKNDEPRLVSVSIQAETTAKERRDRARKENWELIDQLIEAFPAAFSVKNRKPLKIGIKKELMAWGNEQKILEGKLARALKYYVNSKSYLKGTLENSYRIDLDGKLCGKVTSKNKEYAEKKLKQVSERIKQRQGETVDDKKSA